MSHSLLQTGPAGSPHVLALAHGAGAAMDTPFMDAVAEGLAGHGIRVVRFEFPYMAGRRGGGPRRGPDRPAVLTQTWLDVIETLGGAQGLFIGGKSMGGRYASMIADQAGARGLVCLGYPFHAPGKTDKLRVDHLRALKTPALIVQGSRDTMGNAQEVQDYALSAQISLRWLEDGDHSFKPRKKSGRSLEQAMQEAVTATADFILQTT